MSIRFFTLITLVCILGITLTVYRDLGMNVTVAKPSIHNTVIATTSEKPISTSTSPYVHITHKTITNNTATSNEVYTSATTSEENNELEVVSDLVTNIRQIEYNDTYHKYVKINNSCDITVDDTCLKAYSSPTTTSTVRNSLRNGMVLLVDDTIVSQDNSVWYKIAFNEELRYPERLQLPWYIKAESGFIFYDEGILVVDEDTPESEKLIIVERGSQMLYAYENEELFMATSTATGLFATPTPRGHFTLFRKTPTRYMQGPIPGITTTYYDLPGVPWNLYFTHQGAIIHGVYWHNSFGTPYSNGCVNLPPSIARELYEWADIGMTIIVRD